MSLLTTPSTSTESANTPTPQSIKQNLETQLQEIEMLQSMFSNPGEIRIDENELKVLKKYSNESSSTQQQPAPPHLDFSIRLSIESKKFELCVTLPHEYPNVEPDLFVRNEKLNRIQHTKLNRDLVAHITAQDRGTPCIYDAITWLQENGQNYITSEPETNVSASKPINNALVRYWVYSHHIYSTGKRKEITSVASDLTLHGFCLPGKPGIICVEGLEDDCEEWWQTIKAMNWKRIFVKIHEDCSESDRDTFLKFPKFEEIAFQNGHQRSSHMDMSELFKYLEGHGCGYIFKQLFGVEQRSGTEKL